MMRCKVVVACLSVLFAITLVTFGGGMISISYPTFLRIYRQPQSERTQGQNPVLGLKWNEKTEVERKDAVRQTCSPPLQTEHNGFKTGDSIEMILGRINSTDPKWTTKVDNCYTYDRNQSPIPESLLEKRQCQKRLPVAIVIGVKKGGTGTLSRFLGLHPVVSITREMPFPGKQVNASSIAKWIQLMRFSSPFQLTMTESPGFFRSHLTLDFKSYLSSSVKFFVILRNPVDRAISEYLHCVAHSNAPKDRPFDMIYANVRIRETFEKTILEPGGDIVISNLTWLGLYFIHIKKLLKVYRRDQFMFIDGDAFARDPYPTMSKVEEFLRLPKFYKRSHFVKSKTKGFFCAQVPERPDFGCMIPSKGRPHPKVSGDVLRKLQDFYRPYNKALRDQLGLNFSWIYKKK